MITVITAHQRDQEAKYGCLDQAERDVGDFKELQRAAEIDGRVEFQPVYADEIAAEDADQVADQYKDCLLYTSPSPRDR